MLPPVKAALPSPTSSIRPTRLLSLRLLSFRRRLSTQGSVLRAALVLLVLAALGALGWAVQGLAATVSSAASSSDPGAATKLLRNHVFWLNAGPVLIWSYTTFEVVFRSRDAMYLNTLPISGAARSLDIVARVYAVHLPLAVPSFLYGAALLWHGSADVGLYAIFVAALTLLSTIPAATAIHLAAGRSLLSDAKGVRQLMAGQIVASEEAMLLWSPAGGLVVGLLSVVMYDLLLFHGMLAGRSDLLPYAWVLAGVITALSLRAIHAAVVDAFFGIIARFAQAEMPPPYTDEGVPERARGEGLATRLPAGARPYFLRDRRQLRRRFRIDTVVVALFGAVALKLGLDAEPRDTDLAVATSLLNALGATVGILLVSAFRFRGELASGHLDSSLPVDQRSEQIARLAASALEPLAAVLLGTIASLIAGAYLGALMVLVGGTLLVAVLLVGSEWVASKVASHRVVWAGASWRALILAITALVASIEFSSLPVGIG